MTATQWSFGDRVIHQSRPEWGAGTITKAIATMHEGKACQKLTIRFDRAGMKTITTAYAHLTEASGTELPHEPTDNGDPFVIEERPEDIFSRLPEPTTDPFLPVAARFEATLGLYRFKPEGGSLLDWAAMQSGLKDPLSKFARHELEALFGRFALVRDEHLRSLAADLVKKDPSAVRAAVASGPAEARAALRRVDGLR